MIEIYKYTLLKKTTCQLFSCLVHIFKQKVSTVWGPPLETWKTTPPCQGLVIAGRCRGTFDRCVISGCRSCGIRVRNDAAPLLRENLVIGCAGPGMVVWNRGKPVMEETPAW